jgi:hypothetical protein
MWVFSIGWHSTNLQTINEMKRNNKQILHCGTGQVLPNIITGHDKKEGLSNKVINSTILD